jgi:hypothetical protein
MKSVALLFAATVDCNGAVLERVCPALPAEDQREIFGLTVLTFALLMFGMPTSMYSVPPGDVDVVEAPLRNIIVA